MLHRQHSVIGFCVSRGTGRNCYVRGADYVVVNPYGDLSYLQRVQDEVDMLQTLHT